MASYNTIIVKPYSQVWDEALAAEALAPGKLVYKKLVSSVMKYALTDYAAQPNVGIVFENDLVGETIDDDIDSGDRVRVKFPVVGEQILVFGPAAGTAIAVGDYLAVAADGITSKIVATDAVAGSYDAGPPEEVIADIPAYSVEENVANNKGMVFRAEEVLASGTTDRRLLVTVVKA